MFTLMSIILRYTTVLIDSTLTHRPNMLKERLCCRFLRENAVLQDFCYEICVFHDKKESWDDVYGWKRPRQTLPHHLWVNIW